MQPINPDQKTPDCGCLHDLFHFTVDPQASTLKKICIIVGYALFHISTLGIPLLIHHCRQHGFCSPGDGVNTWSRMGQPSQQTIDNAVRGARSGQNVAEVPGADGGQPTGAGGDQSPSTPVQEVTPPPPIPQQGTSEQTGTQETQEHGPEPDKGQSSTPVQEEILQQPLPPSPEGVPGASGEPPAAPVIRPKSPIKPEKSRRPPVQKPKDISPEQGRVELGSLEILRRRYATLPSETLSTLDLLSGVGVPRNLTTYLSHELSLHAPLNSDSPDERERKTIVRSQMQYLDRHYYLLPIAGDGYCFFRALATSWLLSLTSQYKNDPECFTKAALALSTLSEDFSQKNTSTATLCHRMCQLLVNIPLILGDNETTSCSMFEKIISKPPLMENVVVIFFTAFSQFLSEKTILESSSQEAMATLLITSLGEDGENLRQAIQNACSDTANQNIFLKNIQNVTPTDLPTTLTIYRWLLTQTDANSKHKDLFALLENSLQLDFIPEDDFISAVAQVISIIDNNSLLSQLWTAYAAIHPSTRSFIKMYGFLKTHGNHAITLDVGLTPSTVEKFTKKVENTLQPAMSAAFVNGQNLGWSPQETRLFELAQANMRGTLLCRSWISRPEIICSCSKIREVLENCILQMSQQEPQENINEAFQAALQDLQFYPEEYLDYNNFLQTSCIKALTRNHLTPERYVLGLFLNSKPRMIRELVTNSALHRFWCLWNNEMTHRLSQISYDDLRKDLNIGLASAFVSDLPEIKGGILYRQTNYDFLSSLIHILEFQPELIGKQRLMTTLIQNIGELDIVEGNREETNTAVQSALTALETLCPGKYQCFISRLHIFIPETFFGKVTASYLIYLFLISEQTNPTLMPTALPKALRNFTTDYRRCLQKRLVSTLLPKISENKIFDFETRTNNSISGSRFLFNQCMNDPLFRDQVFFGFLHNIPFPVLQQAYIASINQAEAEHVACLSSRLKMVAICELFLGKDVEQLRQTQGNQGFILTDDFRSEDHASIFLLRMSNHYCALVPKEK